MTKSALAVARQAMAVAREALPACSAPTSRKTYTQHQLFAALAVRQFLGTDYRGMEQHLRDWSDLPAVLGLGTRVPDHTTLKRAADRLLSKKDRRPARRHRDGRPAGAAGDGPRGGGFDRVRRAGGEPVLHPPG